MFVAGIVRRRAGYFNAAPAEIINIIVRYFPPLEISQIAEGHTLGQYGKRRHGAVGCVCPVTVARQPVPRFGSDLYTLFKRNIRRIGTAVYL